MKKIELFGDEDGEVFGAFIKSGNLTKLGALRAIKKEMKDCGFEEDELPKIEYLEQVELWVTSGGDYDGYFWWKEPTDTHDFKKKKSIGWGWIYRVL